MSSFAAYQKLLEKIDRFTKPIEARCQSQLSCKPGCSSCCQVHLSLSFVEVSYLAKGFATLSHTHQKTVLQQAKKLQNQERTACPLLVDDRCMLYEYRPIICRTHGLPVSNQELRTKTPSFDVCPLNFETEQPSPEDIIDLDVVNALLFTVNAIFSEEKSDKRVLIADMLLEASQ